MKNINTVLLSVTFLVLFFSNTVSAQDKRTKRIIHKVEKKLKNWDNYFSKWSTLGNIQVDSVSVVRERKEIHLFFSDALSYIPVREYIVEEVKSSLKKRFGFWLRKYKISIFSKGKKIEDYIPNIYRHSLKIDSSRFSGFCNNSKPIVKRNYFLEPAKGLLNKNLAIWHSHGRYYEAKLDRWEWQRARLHSTVEDIFPMTFVLDYLEPMLENAGATVFIPRERDINLNEIIVDNDYSFGKSRLDITNAIIDTLPFGFIWKDTLFSGDNPFKKGSFLSLKPIENNPAEVKYIPEIPQDGMYALYVSYGSSISDEVRYTVNYSGGSKDFKINQAQGSGTWIYLGKFYFKKGVNEENASLIVSSNQPFSIDAIKIGGGMGNVARRPSSEIAPNAWSLKGAKLDFHKDKKQDRINPDNFTWKTSGMPRYLEAARYYLQYSGMPDSIVYSLSHGKNDYNDDYKSRGEWVNYLMGKPNGPTGHNNVNGLGIPIDMALAFHTDAGVTDNDSIIGTLAIYNSAVPDSIFPLNQSKMVNRDLVDIVQSQIVNDIRVLHNPMWTRRGIWNKPYSEAWRANTPMMLLELMSHQNLADMRFGLDHRFKFDVGRAIYKGILKFLAFQNHFDYVVQPLPIDHFSMRFLGNKKIRLSWSLVLDSLEVTAKPIAYKVYTRKQGEGFDQGVLVKGQFVDIEIDTFNRIYSFKVTALNDGGESFPSEILSFGLKEKSKMALIVNAFDRVSAPAVFDGNDRAGFDYQSDMGVSYIHEIGLVGKPYEFNRNVPWVDDDNPGWGASFANWEGKVIAGNSFDYPFVHGKSILNSGYSFISTSDEAFAAKDYKINGIDFVDIIFGEERTIKGILKDDFTVFKPEMILKIKQITSKGVNILLSGAYIGSDFAENQNKNIQSFAERVLHYKWRTNFASKSGEIYSTDYVRNEFNGQWKFNTALNKKVYTIEAPDGIEPVGKNAITAFRYNDTGVSAGVIYNGKYKVVSLGFPFETIIDSDKRDSLMKQVIRFFE